MKKYIPVLCLALALCFVFISCDKKENDVISYDTNVEEIQSALIENDFFKDGVVYSSLDNPLSELYAEYYFGSKEVLDGVVSYTLILSPTTDVCEVGVFKVENDDARDALLKGFENRKSSLISTHTNYSETDLEKAQNLTTGLFADIVYYVATSDNASVEEIIKR